MEEPPNPVVNLEEHPLQNQVILKIIFDLLESSATLEDWKNIRLVCKLWHSQTLSRWRNNAILDLIGKAPLFEPRSRSRSQKLTPSGLLILCQNPNDPYKLKEQPYLNYKLQGQTIDVSFCKRSLTASLFWSTVGPWMRTLILKQVNIWGNDVENKQLLKFLIKKTPNLTNVTLDNMFLEEIRLGIPLEVIVPDRRRMCHPSVVSLTCKETFGYHFSCFPNLQKVRLECAQPIEFANMVFPKFPAIPKQNPVRNSKVTHLDMINCVVNFKPGRRDTFQSIKFPSLDHLSVNLNYPPDEFGGNMIDNHRETLKILETFCWVPPQFGDWAIRYPMPVLSKLFIWGNCMDNLDFLRFMPNLTLLHIDLYGFEKKEEMKKLVERGPLEVISARAYIPTGDKVEASRLSGNLAGVVLQKLEYFQLNYKVGSESVQALGESMPNLKIFKGVLDSSTLPVVCEVWPKLEKLHCLFGSEIADEDVIGSGNEESKKGVADLKHLTSFHYNSECDKSSLSDKSVKEGFLKMKELTDLQICVSQELSQESEDALTSRILNVKLYQNYSTNCQHKDWDCCKDKKYLEYISNYTHRELRQRDRFYDSDYDYY